MEDGDRRHILRPVISDHAAEMADAVRTGLLDRNTVDATVSALRTGKPRAREFPEWGEATGLFGLPAETAVPTGRQAG